MDSLAKLLFAVLFAFSMYSCGRTEVSKRLTDIESYINERPDSALSAIRQIDTLSLRTKAEKAKYSLLHAMALDKNYIDTTDTRIIAPAVEYYSRHGNTEDRLKSLMYLGVEQYNAGLYNQAIVSFYQASEYAPKVEDQNLLGILYSRMADTYTMTRDYVQAEEYIDRSLECFKLDGNASQELLELARKAHNFAQQKKWREAETIYEEILKDSLVNGRTKAQIEIDYALCLLYSPSCKESKAYSLMDNGLSKGVFLSNEDQVGALAFLKHIHGEKAASDSLFSLIDSHNKKHYWKYRIALKEDDFKRAHDELLISSLILDSLQNSLNIKSAANSQRLFLEQLQTENNNRIQQQKLWLVLIVVLCCLFASLTFLLRLVAKNKNREQEAERERMILLTESLRNQILDQKRINDKLSRETSKAKFAFMADVYEAAYRMIDEKESAEDEILHILQSKIGDLRVNNDAQLFFERMLDAETHNLMTKFRQDYPGLKEEEYKMISYYFAGFDNTTVMIILGISSLENARMKKSRLKQKITKSECPRKNDYLCFL